MGSGSEPTHPDSEAVKGKMNELEEWVDKALYDWVLKVSQHTQGSQGRVQALEKWMGDMYNWALEVKEQLPGLIAEPPRPPGWTGERIGVDPPARPR